MSSDIVTSSHNNKRRTRSATKAILDFEGNLWLKLPKLGRKAMLGMMEGREIARLDTAMVQWEGRRALHEAYEKTEVSGLSSPIDCPSIVMTGSTRTLKSCL